MSIIFVELKSIVVNEIKARVFASEFWCNPDPLSAINSAAQLIQGNKKLL